MEIDLNVALAIASPIVMAVTVITANKIDTKWIKEWMRKHDKDDVRNFARIDGQIAKIREKLFHESL